MHFHKEQLNIFIQISSLYLSVHLIICQQWFRKWLGTEQAATHYLNQWWPSSVFSDTITEPQWVNKPYIEHPILHTDQLNHWNKNVIMMKFSSLTALQVVILTGAYRCPPAPIFHSPFVHQSLCFPVLMFPDPIFPSSYVPQSLSSPTT